MKIARRIFNFGGGGLVGSLVVFLVGFSMLSPQPQAELGSNVLSRLSQKLTRASYDWSFDFSPFARGHLRDSDAVIVYIDENSLKDLGQPLGAPMDRSLHAKLLEKLKTDGARAVVFDLIFEAPGPDENADQLFTSALRSNGRAVLGVDYNADETQGLARLKHFTVPHDSFKEAAAGLGLVQLRPDSDYTVRQHFHHLDQMDGGPPSLSWAAAEMVGSKFVADPALKDGESWINYYGPPGAIPHVSYNQASAPSGVPPGFFRDKVVFVGSRPFTGHFITKRDELRSPYTFQGTDFVWMPMVEIHATEFLNLVRGDWLERPSYLNRLLILVVSSLAFGFGFLRFRPRVAVGIALGAALAVWLAAQAMFVTQHIWFEWLIIVAAQIPCALLYSIVFRSVEWMAHRRRLEEERRRADSRIREQAALLDKAQDAIMVHDLEWRAQYFNRSAERLYGWTFDELAGKNLQTEVFKSDEAKVLGAVQMALATGEWSGDLTHSTRDGRQILVHSRWTLVRNAAGHPQSLFVINTDITEQRSLEMQFLRTQRMESIGTLAGGIAHDLNNILSPIMMGVELVKMKSPDESIQRILNSMSTSARRASDMVRQVLTFARGEVGERRVVQISHLIREMHKIARETFPKNIELSTEVGNISPILGDATQIHQIILNLCVNARDAMPDGGKIVIGARNVRLSVEEAGRHLGAEPVEYVLLYVTDTGSGIPPEIIDKIFEPFFTTKEIGKGTGLGLSTVISIIKSHGGFLDLKSEVGQGTSFNVYLPAAESGAAAETEVSLGRDLWGRGETILVVDDEADVLELTKTVLVHHGYKVITALHGADALALFAQYKATIRVAVVDVMMPVMDGPAAIRCMRLELPDLPIIAISGLSKLETLTEQIGADTFTFLAKPYSSEALLRQIRISLARAARELTAIGSREN